MAYLFRKRDSRMAFQYYFPHSSDVKTRNTLIWKTLTDN